MVTGVTFTFLLIATLGLQTAAPARLAWHQTLDLGVGEEAQVTLRDGSKAVVRLLDMDEPRDAFRAAVRDARVTIVVNGAKSDLVCGNYRLPLTLGGVQVDCPVTQGLLSNATGDFWGLEKAARLRIWPAGSPWIEPGTFRYPARERWFASGTQMSNEPTFVDGGEKPADKKIYYHSGLDIGGAEGLVDVVAATDGLVVSSGDDRLAGHDGTPVAPRYDVVYLLDDRGWYYRYSHLKTIDPAIEPGAKVRIGQKVGVLGKEGGSGGWSHLHFEISSRQPSGKWGTEDGYAFLWQAYVAEFQPAILAVARPHRLAAVGEPVTLDGSRSWSSTKSPLRYQWFLSSGAADAEGPRVTRRYDRPGTYSEVLKVTDSSGNTAFDFAVVQVLDPKEPTALPPSIQAAYAPTMDIRVGDLVTFKTRTFRTTDGEEAWDFDDGGPGVKVKSDGNVNIHDPNGFAVTGHRFQKPGDFIVTVSRANARGFRATAHLWVHVSPAREGEPSPRAAAQAPAGAATPFAWPDGKQVALSLSFDDARASQVQGGTALLDKYGVKATFYLVPSSAERQLDGWRRAAAGGHEIGNHSLNHPCSGNFAWSRSKALEDYTLDQIERELTDANRRITELLGVTPASFAYPCGQTFVGRGEQTKSYVPVAARLFTTSRGWLDEAPNDPAYVDFAQITGIESDGKDFDRIRTIVEDARKTGLWVVLAGHDIGRDGPQTTRMSMLDALCAYAANPANGVWIAPVGTVAKYVQAQRARLGMR